MMKIRMIAVGAAMMAALFGAAELPLAARVNAGPIVSPGFVGIPGGAVRGYVTQNNRPVSGAWVALVRPNGTVWATTWAASNGSYAFHTAPIGESLSVRATFRGRSGFLRGCAFFQRGTRTPASGCNVRIP